MCAWCLRTPLDDSVGRMEDILEEVAQHREPEALQQYLQKVRPAGWGPFSWPLVPTEGPGVGPFSLEGLSVPRDEMGAVLGVSSDPLGPRPRP